MSKLLKWIKRKPVKKVDTNDLIIDQLSSVRGIENLDHWLNPPSSYVHSAYFLDNIDEAVQEIVKAIHQELKVQIVADIDTDGVCSTAIMYNYLSTLTPNVSYIHAQRSKGHGIETVLDKIENDTDLVIVVDSSSNSVEGCKKVSEKGKKIIIIDHHEIDVDNPYALIVNCQQGDYPNRDLSGSAMVYKVCQVLDEYMGIEFADQFLDLTAVGLVGDMMDISNMENRYLIHNGIRKIYNDGLKTILKKSNIDFVDGITTTDISFKVAPIIGACSRFDKIELALELLTSTDMDRILELTKTMIDMNEKRKSEQKQVVERLIENVDDSDNLIVIIDNDIDSGFRGLVATEVVEHFSKPVFVVSYDKEKDSYTGSARSVGLIDLKELCQKSGLFHFATGHAQAHGISFSKEKLNKVYEYFNEVLEQDDLQKVVEYDLELAISEIDDFDIKEIEKFSKIVGQGFPEPKFRISGIIAEESETKKLGTHVRAVLGKNLDTIKINCEDGLALMKFRSNDKYALDIEEHFYDNFTTELEVIGSININKFYNFGIKQWVISNQIFLEDYRIVE